MTDLRLEKKQDADSITALYEDVIGPGRFARTAERLREGNSPIDTLCMVACVKNSGSPDKASGKASHKASGGTTIVASIRYWPIRVHTHPLLLLGPLVVALHKQGLGLGSGLMRETLKKAQQDKAYEGILLVGDADYYKKAGFQPVPVGNIIMPGPVDMERLLIFPLTKNALAIKGDVKPAPDLKAGA